MSTETITAGQGTIITVGNGNNTVSISGGSQDTITIGNGTNNLTVTGGTGDTIMAGSGNDTITVTGGSNNTITVGNGNDTLVVSGDHNDTINVGMGNDTVYLGVNDMVNIGKGSVLLVLPPSTPALAVASISVSEDQIVSLASFGISASLSVLGFGQENIFGFAAADQLEFTTAQFADFQALMAAATQVGQNTIITRVSGNTVVQLVQRDLTANPQTNNILASKTLTAAQLAGNNQIEFQLSHVASSTAITGAFELLNNGTVTFTTSFVPTATIFTNGVNWTRVDLGAFTSPGVGLNAAAGQSPHVGQTLIATASTNDSDATINYQWQESSTPSFTTFTNIGANNVSYTVQGSDAGSFIRVVATTSDPDSPQSATAMSPATGAVLPDPPATPVMIANGAAFEITSASADAVTFGGNTGTLQLDESRNFVGTVTAFGDQNQIDLGDIAFSTNATLGYAVNSDNSGGLLTVSDGVHVANLALLGQYSAAGFATGSDGHGGTFVTYPPIGRAGPAHPAAWMRHHDFQSPLGAVSRSGPVSGSPSSGRGRDHHFACVTAAMRSARSFSQIPVGLYARNKLALGLDPTVRA